jgi:Uma2 family endonuclease
MRTMEPEMEIVVPASTKFPIELEAPAGFVVDDPATWPQVEGRLEYVSGRLLWMPPCGVYHQLVSASVAGMLWEWLRSHPTFVVGACEAGMLLDGDVRGAEGAVWRRADYPPLSHSYVPVAPILAAEVAGRDEREPQLREKARWYFARGVQIVWIVLPPEREVVVLDRDGHDTRHGRGARLPVRAELPDLAPAVDDFFAQLG